MLLIKIQGVLRVIEEMTTESGKTKGKVITGYRERRSVASSSPGGGWRPVPGTKRHWVKAEPKYDVIDISADEVIKSDGWPIGAEKNGFKISDYESLISPLVRAGVDSMGPMGAKKPPTILVLVIETKVKEAGLAIPTELEMEEIVNGIWRQNHWSGRRTMDVFSRFSPVDLPVEKPAEAPVEKPVEKPAEAPVEAPVEKPASPAEKVDPLAETPDDPPAEKPPRGSTKPR